MCGDPRETGGRIPKRVLGPGAAGNCARSDVPGRGGLVSLLRASARRAPPPREVRPIVRLRLFLLLCLVAVAFVPSGAAAQSEDQRQLDRVKQRVAEIARRVEAAEGQLGTAQAELDEADRQLAALEAAVNEAAAALTRQQQTVARADRTLRELEDRVEALQATFGQRAADIYKSGSGVPFQILLTAGTVQAAIDRSAFIRVITAADQATLEDVHNAQVQLRAQQRRSDEERDRLLAMQQEQQELLEQVAALRQRRAMAAAEARRRLAGLQDEHDELSADVDRITTMIRERKITPVSASLPSTAGYLWPRCDRVTSGYGRRWGRLHAGIDIAGRTGDYIAASKAGVVIFAGSQSGYGNLVLIDHGDGVVTAYGHQSRILVGDGQRVERGERIGDVGNTGRSTGPHLHFETRVHGNPVDPRKYLPKSC